MKDYRLLLCIVRRDQYESYLNMFKSNLRKVTSGNDNKHTTIQL